MRTVKNILAGLWLLWTASWYFEYHGYYFSTISQIWSKFLGFIIMWTAVFAIIWAVQAIRKKKSITLTPLRVILFFIVAVGLTGASRYAMLDPAVFAEEYQIVFYSDTDFMVVEEGVELGEGYHATFTRGTEMLNASEGLKMFPEEIQELFAYKSLWAFTWTLLLNTLKILGIWAGLIFLFHNLGAAILRQKKVTWDSFFKAVGIGMGAMMLVLFLLGIVGLLTAGMVWATVILLLMGTSFKAKSFISALWKAQHEISFKELKWTAPIFAALTILLGINFIDTFSPVPIGNDSLNVYHNIPNLLNDYGALISGVHTYNFELIIGLGHFLFDSATIGLMIVFMGSLLAFGLLFDTLRKKFSWQVSLLLTAVFVSLPMTSFLLHIDPKIDMPLFFFSLLAIRCTIEWWQNRDKKEARKHLILLGVFLGIAFGVKYTASLLIIAIFAFMTYETVGVGGLITVTLLSLGVLGLMDYLQPLDLYSSDTKRMVIYGLLGFGVIAGIATIVKGKKVLAKLKPLLLCGLIMVTVFSPWVIRNGILSKSLDPGKLLNGPKIGIVADFNDLKKEYGVCTNWSRYYEFKAYTNYEEGLSAFLKIPWLISANPSHENNRFTDISFLFIGFFLMAVLGWKESARKDKNLKLITGFTIYYFLLWWLTTNGIIWYGMPLFLGALVIYGKEWEREKWPYFVLAFWLLLSVWFRFSDGVVMNTNLYYAGGLIDDEIVLHMRFTGNEDAAKIVNSEEGKEGKVLLFGTNFQYFVEENDTRVFRDRLFDDFMCYIRKDTAEETLEAMREMNIKFIATKEDELVLDREHGGEEIQEFIEWFNSFADEELVVEVRSDDITLYSVPD